MKEQKVGPHIITEAGEAGLEYLKLMAMNFEVRRRGVTIDEARFKLCLETGIRVDVRRTGWAGETVHQRDWEYMEDILEYAKSNQTEVYAMLVAADYEPYLQGVELEEAEFIEIAKGRGSVDLVRARLNTKGEMLVNRYYGTAIGRSNALVAIVSKGGDGELVN